MEPKILATPIDSMAGSADWASRAESSSRALGTETVISPSFASVSASALAGNHGPALADSDTLTLPAHRAPGFTNGHHMNGLNGHSNGHGQAWPSLATIATSGTYPREVPVFEAAPGEGFYLRFGKRVIDVAGSLFALLLSAPVLLIAAILIKLESRGPILYKSIRIGRGGRPFTFYKLRSMVNGADQHLDVLSHLNETDGPVFKIARDPRVTRVGRFMRTTSIDELPQLLNVLRGEMSLVGPRPPIPREVDAYEPWQMRRLDVPPGLTCLWQISGRSRIGFQEWMRLDLEYIKQQSFWLDVKILVRTIPAVLSREGAY
jgi:lipopolysaccharide/colanic/teichoic acid biosynthesis glycosyltransferase